MHNNCSDCTHSAREDTGDQLYCRRYPPSASVVVVPRQTLQGVVPSMQTIAAFPPVQPHQHCGEWQNAARLHLS